ncbi:20498_t:CDS:2, partial [Racocetra persica]
KQSSEKWENKAKECEKHREQIENRINEIISSHLNINITKIEKNLSTIEKLDTILNTIKQKVKECLKLLSIPFQTGDSLMSMLKKLVKMLKKLDPKTQINDSKSFNRNPRHGSMDILAKACYKKGWVTDSDSEFKCLKLLTPQISDFNPGYNYIDDLVKACYDYEPTTKNDSKYKDIKYHSKPTSTLNVSLNKRNKVVYDSDEQNFLGLPFKIKVETTDEIVSAKLSFVNKNDGENIDIPNGITCKDFTEKRRKSKPPLSEYNFFLLNYPNKYDGFKTVFTSFVKRDIMSE